MPTDVCEPPWTSSSSPLLGKGGGSLAARKRPGQLGLKCFDAGLEHGRLLQGSAGKCRDRARRHRHGATKSPSSTTLSVTGIDRKSGVVDSSEIRGNRFLETTVAVKPIAA